MKTKNTLIKVGDFFFKWRNVAFPLVVLSLLFAFTPPNRYLGSELVILGKDFVATAIILLGLIIRSATIGLDYILRGGLNKKVHAERLVTGGYFCMCRNPLYVGNMMIYSGIFILHGHPLVIAIGIGLYYFIYTAIIAAEEYFLENKFGDEYRQYCAQTPRWMINFANYQQATENMNFRYLRVIAKDYTTIFNALVAIVVVELLKSHSQNFGHIPQESLVVAGVIMALLLVALVVIKRFKKAGKFKQI